MSKSSIGIACVVLLLCVHHSHQDATEQNHIQGMQSPVPRVKRHEIEKEDHHHQDHHHDHANETDLDCPDGFVRQDHHGEQYCVSGSRFTDYRVWCSAVAAVLIISLCGIFGVLVVPIMEQIFYQHLIQFLIALAIGTLSGDALLHLIPHAIVMGQTDVDWRSAHAIMEAATWKGFVALVALVVFFLLERTINIVGEWKESRDHQRNKDKKVKIVRSGHKTSDKAVGERLCKHKYSTYCVRDIDPEKVQTDPIEVKDENEVMLTSACSDEDASPCVSKSKSLEKVSKEENGLHKPTLSTSSSVDEYDTVFVRQHEHVHHGHSHAHSHLHSTPKSISSVAWMVIFGDGIHNLADGLAIGAAFVQDPLAGIATSIAILCHELPHEIGDFAMLLKTGMSLRQAIFYNIISSVLSFTGMVIGVFLGNLSGWAGWIFAATAGIFLYVALVDMIPELNSGHSHPISDSIQTESHYLELGLQLFGLCLGIGIMLLIAVYEDSLKDMFKG